MRREACGLLVPVAMVLALSCCGSALAATSPLQKASLHCDRGFKALDSGELDRARRAFEQAVKVAPSYPEAHIGLGHVAIREKRYEEALASYLAARKGYGELADQLFNIENQRYAEVRQTLPRLQLQLVQIQSGQTKMTASERRWALESIREKIRDLEMVQPPEKDRMAEPPGRVDFYVGNALCRTGQWEAAVEAYEICLTKLPKFGEAWNNLALAYWKADRHQDALGSLQKAEELGFEVNPRFKADLERSYEKKRKAAAAADGS